MTEPAEGSPVEPGEIHVLRDGEAPAAGAQVEAGVISDVVYVGPITRLHVALDRGGDLQVFTQNLETTSTEVLETKGRRVRLQWRLEQQSAIATNGRDHE